MPSNTHTKTKHRFIKILKKIKKNHFLKLTGKMMSSYFCVFYPCPLPLLFLFCHKCVRCLKVLFFLCLFFILPIFLRLCRHSAAGSAPSSSWWWDPIAPRGRSGCSWTPGWTRPLRSPAWRMKEGRPEGRETTSVMRAGRRVTPLTFLNVLNYTHVIFSVTVESMNMDEYSNSLNQHLATIILAHSHSIVTLPWQPSLHRQDSTLK